MQKQPNKRKIAIFVILGFALMLGILLKNVVARLTADQKNMAVMYFSESINGLTVGSPVVFQGVQVGKVVGIEIITDPKTLEFNIPVYVRFSSDNDEIKTFNSRKPASRRAVLHTLINKGLRARLTTQNLLTGQLMIELKMMPNTPIDLKQPENNQTIFEIPTTLSALGGISKDLQDLPLKQILARADNVLSELEKGVPQVLQSFAKLGDNLNLYTNQSAPQTAQTLNQLNRTLRDVSAASLSVKNLSDYLERHPDALIKGKKE